MEDIIFLKIWGPAIFQPWLLGVCFFLCLIPGNLSTACFEQWRVNWLAQHLAETELQCNGNSAGCETDGLVCRQCVSMFPMSPCLPSKGFCYVRDGACFTLEIFGEKRMEKFMLGCEEDRKHKCGIRWRNEKNNFLYKISCCTDKDKCNRKPWIRPWKNFDNEEISRFENLNSTEAPATTSKGPILNLDDSNGTT